MRRVWFAVGALVLAAAAITLVRWDSSDPTPWEKPATVDGDAVHLRYIGSLCQDGSSVEVEETGDEVVLTVRATVRGGSCPDVGIPYEIDAQLEAPLGDRELVDGACLSEEYAHYSACSSKQTH